MLNIKRVYSLSRDLKLPNFLKSTFTTTGTTYKNFDKKKSFWSKIKETTPDLVIYHLPNFTKEELGKFITVKRLLNKIDVEILVTGCPASPRMKKFFSINNIYSYLSEVFSQKEICLKLYEIFSKREKSKSTFCFKPLAQSLTIKMMAKLTKVGELSCQVNSPIKVTSPSSSIKITHHSLNCLGVYFSKIKTCGPSTFQTKHHYATEFQFLGMSERSAQIIRSTRNRWGH